MRYRALVVDDLGVLRPGPGAAPPPDGVAGLVRQARAAGLRTAVLSNAPAVDPAAGFEALVDLVCVSGGTGLAKPDPRAFLDCARRLGVAPQECVLVDDLASNVRGAVRAGMTGVVHHTVEGTAAELAVLLDGSWNRT